MYSLLKICVIFTYILPTIIVHYKNNDVMIPKEFLNIFEWHDLTPGFYFIFDNIKYIVISMFLFLLLFYLLYSESKKNIKMNFVFMIVVSISSIFIMSATLVCFNMDYPIMALFFNCLKVVVLSQSVYSYFLLLFVLMTILMMKRK